MPEVFLAVAAREDLVSIGHHTLMRWGDAQTAASGDVTILRILHQSQDFERYL